MWFPLNVTKDPRGMVDTGSEGMNMGGHQQVTP